MAEKSEIVVVITFDGEVRVETKGLTGEACLAETKGLETAVGKVTSRTKTREFYGPPAAAKTNVTRKR